MDSRILTIDSLIEYCEKNNFSHFSAKEIGKTLVVNTFGNISFEENKDPSLMSVTLKACHCGINRNNSKRKIVMITNNIHILKIINLKIRLFIVVN